MGAEEYGEGRLGFAQITDYQPFLLAINFHELREHPLTIEFWAKSIHLSRMSALLHIIFARSEHVRVPNMCRMNRRSPNTAPTESAPAK
jgi:hypothetical protein